MNNNSIRVSESSLKLLKEIKEEYKHPSYDYCINSMAVYFLKFKINPDEDFVGDFKSHLINFEIRLAKSFEDFSKKMLKDNTSVRNFMGGIEKDYLKPLNSKLTILDKINHYEVSKKSQENLNNAIDKKLDKQMKSSEQSSSVDTSEKQNFSEEKEEKIKRLFDLNAQYKKALFNIFDNYKVEKIGMMGTEKIIINMPIDEWNEYKNLI